MNLASIVEGKTSIIFSLTLTSITFCLNPTFSAMRLIVEPGFGETSEYANIPCSSVVPFAIMSFSFFTVTSASLTGVMPSSAVTITSRLFCT